MKKLKLITTSDSGKDFYRYYLSEFHQVKLKNLLFLLEKKGDRINSLQEETFNIDLSKNFDQIIYADIRANYFHCIETFFELFFALLPDENGNIPDNLRLNERLLKSNPKKNSDSIRKIAHGKNKLDLLKAKIEVGGFKVSILQYLFYYGTFKMSDSDDEFNQTILQSEAGLLQAITELANVFANRFEYNSYKHGLRITRSIDSLAILDGKTLKYLSQLDFSKSFTYQVYNKEKDSIDTISKNFDLEHIKNMTYLCSNMIMNIMFLRKVSFNKDEIDDEMLPIACFDTSEIQKCFKINIPLAELKITTE